MARKNKYDPKMSDYFYLHKTQPFYKHFGPKHISMVKSFIPSMAFFSGAAAVFGLYFTDWRVIVGYMPFYNTKFKDETPQVVKPKDENPREEKPPEEKPQE